MKNVKNLSMLLAVMAIAVFSACKKDLTGSQDALQYVPENSTAVSAVNLKSLMQKADFEAVKQMEFYQAMVKETSQDHPDLAEILMNPAASGIDLEQKMYMSTVLDQNDPEKATMYMMILLKDADAFGKMMKDKDMEFVQQNGINLLKDPRGNASFGWNEKLAVFTFGNSSDETMDSLLPGIFEPAPKNTLASNKDVLKALDGNHDLTTWMSTDALAASSAAKMGVNMLDLDEDILKGNSIHSYADFEKGAVKGHSDFYIGKELGEKFIGRFFKKEVDTDFSKILPKENLAFAAVGAVDFRGIDQFLSERPETKGFADFALNDLGMKREDLIAMLGGDVMVAGFNESAENPSFMVATNVKNEQKAKEFLAAAVQQKKLKEIEKDFYKVTSVGNADFSITVNKGMGKLLMKDGLLIYSTDDGLLEKIKSGNLSGADLADKKSLSHFDDQTLAGWFTFSALQRTLQAPGAEYFKDIKFNVNGKGADFILETTETNTNSLQTFFKMINQAYLKNKLGEEEAM